MNSSRPPAFDADGLYEIVRTYVGFGNHHTGTSADDRTTAWLIDLLERMGASVTEDRFRFDRFAGTAELRAGGEIVPSLPVFYSAAGTWRTSDLAIVDVDVTVAGNPRGLEPHLSAEPDAEALVLALDGPDDLVVQCNRVPTMPATGGRPAVIVPGNWANRLRRSDMELAFDAKVEQGASANVIAALGAPDAPAINLTTPLTGWTPAGGERGTGLAAALAMAADLSVDHRVTLSVCSGHEIDHIGLKHYLAGLDVVGEPVVHLGASVAATEPDSTGPARLGDRRMVLTTASGELREEIGRRVPAANWQLRAADPWPGEGGTWFEAGASVLSFLGGASLFHTTADTEAATSPEALALAAAVAIDAARLFLDS